MKEELYIGMYDDQSNSIRAALEERKPKKRKQYVFSEVFAVSEHEDRPNWSIDQWINDLIGQSYSHFIIERILQFQIVAFEQKRFENVFKKFMVVVLCELVEQ